MHEKGCVLDVVPWKRSRCTLYWRLRRLLLQHRVVSDILQAQPHLSVGQAEAMLRRWFIEDKTASDCYLWDDNECVVEWLEEQRDEEEGTIAKNLLAVEKDAKINQIKECLEACPDIALDAVVELIHKLGPHQKAEVIRTLSQLEEQSETTEQTHVIS